MMTGIALRLQRLEHGDLMGQRMQSHRGGQRVEIGVAPRAHDLNESVVVVRFEGALIPVLGKRRFELSQNGGVVHVG